MQAGTCSSCGTTAFSGTNVIKSHGLMPGVALQLSRKSLTAYRSCQRSSQLRVNAIGGGGKPEDKKTLSREDEPEQFWQTKTEAKGENPIKDPLAIIGLAGILLPFIILGIAIATGVIDTSAGSSYATGK